MRARRGRERCGLWSGALGGMEARVEVMVVQGRRVVVWGEEEWVGGGKLGRGSPGLACWVDVGSGSLKWGDGGLTMKQS